MASRARQAGPSPWGLQHGGLSGQTPSTVSQEEEGIKPLTGFIWGPRDHLLGDTEWTGIVPDCKRESRL